jgi:hypothetical protein
MDQQQDELFRIIQKNSRVLQRWKQEDQVL